MDFEHYEKDGTEVEKRLNMIIDFLVFRASDTPTTNSPVGISSGTFIGIAWLNGT